MLEISWVIPYIELVGSDSTHIQRRKRKVRIHERVAPQLGERIVKVVIVGAGVIGLCSAYYLSGAGHDVTLIDAGTPGRGASSHNAGWVVPSMSTPVAAPGMLVKSLGWLFRPDSPLYIRPSADPQTIRFLLNMARQTSPVRYKAGIQALSHLNRRTDELFDGMRQAGLVFEHHQDPLTMLFTDQAKLDAHVADLELMDSAADTPRWRALDRAALERELPGVSPDVVGGVVTRGDRSVDPQSFTTALLGACHDRGVEVVTGTPAQLHSSSGRVEVTAGKIRWAPDRTVVAAGVWSNQVLRPLGERLALLSGKGYGFDLPKLPGFPNQPLYLSEAKVAVTPLESKIRFSGTMGFGGIDETINSRRAGGILTSAQNYFSNWDLPAANAKPWTGLRPMTPDGVPFIGPLAKHPNVLVATGHQMLGVTLGPSTGALLADMLDRHSPSPIPVALDARRTL